MRVRFFCLTIGYVSVEANRAISDRYTEDSLTRFILADAFVKHCPIGMVFSLLKTHKPSGKIENNLWIAE